MMRWTMLMLGVTLAIAALATGVAAEDEDLVSVSGECYNYTYDEGGGAHVVVTQDGQVNENGVWTNDDGELDPTQSGGAVDALTYFGTRSVESSPGEACDGPDKGEETETHKKRANNDYLAVSAGPVMVCYDGNPNFWTSPDAWNCPQRPGGIPEEKDDE